MILFIIRVNIVKNNPQHVLSTRNEPVSIPKEIYKGIYYERVASKALLRKNLHFLSIFADYWIPLVAIHAS